MNRQTPETLSVLPNPSVFRGMLFVQRVCLALSGLAVLDVLWTWLRVRWSTTPHPGATPISASIMLTLIVCFASLLLSEPESSGQLLGYLRRLVNLLACLALLGLIVVTEFVFEVVPVFGRSSTSSASPVILICLALLSLVVVLRQAEHGVFAIFMGVGIGSRLARIFAPILLALPFLREAVVAGLTKSGVLPGPYGDAILASAGATILFAILLFFTWRISGMENEIHDLILRDDVTRLYNFRGFHMLAEHALRLAQRSSLPFSVLFIDLENVNKINAELGADAATAYLAQAGELLRKTFRESDIKGRIGRDEFAIAGQFDRTGITVAALRLEAASVAHRSEGGLRFPLTFRIGHVTSNEDSHESLKDLLARADKSRYQQKRLKDLPVN